MAADISFIKKQFDEPNKLPRFLRLNLNNDVDIFLHMSTDIANFTYSGNCIIQVCVHLFFNRIDFITK